MFLTALAIHAAGLQDRQRRRRHHEPDQLAGGRGARRIAAGGRNHDQVVLDVRREGAEHFDARRRQDLTERHDAEGRVAFRDRRRDIDAGRDRLELRLQISRKPETLDEPDEIRPRGAFLRERDGRRREQRALQRLRAPDIGLACALPDRHRHARACQLGARFPHQPSLLDPIVDELGREDGQIERLSGVDLTFQRSGQSVRDDHAMPGGFLEPRDDLLHDRADAVRAEHGNLVCSCGGCEREPGEDGERSGCRTCTGEPSHRVRPPFLNFKGLPLAFTADFLGTLASISRVRCSTVLSHSIWSWQPVRNTSTNDSGNPEKSMARRPQSGRRPSWSLNLYLRASSHELRSCPACFDTSGSCASAAIARPTKSGDSDSKKFLSWLPASRQLASVTPWCCSIDSERRKPGVIATAVTPCPLSSEAMLSASPLSANFTVQESGVPPAPKMSLSVTSAMRPPPCLIMMGAACFAVMMCDRIACLKMASAFVTSTFQNDAHFDIIGSSPATLSARMSIRPCSFSTRANSASTSDSTVWSTRTAMAFPPMASIISTVASIVSGLPYGER